VYGYAFFVCPVFTQFVGKYQKAYAASAFAAKMLVFNANLDAITKHNQKKSSFKLAVNKFADLTKAEFKLHLGLKTTDAKSIRPSAFLAFAEDAELTNEELTEKEKEKDKKKKAEEEAAKKKAEEDAKKKKTPYQEMIERQKAAKAAEEALAAKRANYPKSIDWAEKIGPAWKIKNQGSCGSCWAFAVVGMTEATHAIASKSVLDLSEQELLDCVGDDSTCAGGFINQAASYVAAGGVAAEGDYPYTKRRGTCNKATAARSAAKLPRVTAIARHEPAYIDALQEGVITIGVSAERTLQFYKEGIIDDCGPNVDHAVVLVGYGVSSTGTPFYKIRNSWGETWGDKGYFYVNRNNSIRSPCAMYDYMSLAVAPATAPVPGL
jgi:C1A family cysteine protease